MDATTGTDQTGKRYWHRVEDNYCRIKPKNCGFLSRSYRSLQGRWDLMKPACARWSAAMDQVRDAPPSGTVESDYETIAGMRYKEMAASKGKPFPFKHAWAILQTFDKWKLRDQETAPKKSAMLRMDDSEDEEKERNLGKPEGTKKGKQRVKMEGEASSLREKMEQMMKAREELTRKTLENKILITEKKKEVKLAQVEAKREEAKHKADMEERMIKLALHEDGVVERIEGGKKRAQENRFLASFVGLPALARSRGCARFGSLGAAESISWLS
ncbi:uncharacterized protein LOC123405363 [Hordeum vulgare subsp. vulgare]|uniref:uncharacterized protein LOC123405363 n=1 Tax=Hordeum vulgare subsp. vulgare TaxID=112509 RepID=UPI001D1A5526|nr:uncharacterized protein LOC123405363 [Hordeum vulgare subsp. vulgare]